MQPVIGCIPDCNWFVAAAAEVTVAIVGDTAAAQCRQRRWDAGADLAAGHLIPRLSLPRRISSGLPYEAHASTCSSSPSCNKQNKSSHSTTFPLTRSRRHGRRVSCHTWLERTTQGGGEKVGPERRGSSCREMTLLSVSMEPLMSMSLGFSDS